MNKIDMETMKPKYMETMEMEPKYVGNTHIEFNGEPQNKDGIAFIETFVCPIKNIKMKSYMKSYKSYKYKAFFINCEPVSENTWNITKKLIQNAKNTLDITEKKNNITKCKNFEEYGRMMAKIDTKIDKQILNAKI